MKLLFNEQRSAAVRALFPENAAVRRLFVTNEGEKPLAQWTWRDLADTRHELRADLEQKLPALAARQSTDEERAAVEAVKHIIELLRHEMNARDARGDREPRALTSGAPAADDAPAARPDGIWFRDLHSGAAVRAVKHGESFRLGVPNLQRPAAPLGEFFRSLALGRPTVPELEQELRTIITTTTGVPIPTPYGAAMYDLAREQSNVSQLGAIFVPMTSKTLQITKVTADPSVGWKDESSAFSASDPTLATVTLTAKTVGILAKASEEAVMDASDFGSRLEGVLRGAIAAELDRVALVGSGTGAEPAGIMRSGVTPATDVQTLSVGGTPTDYAWGSRLVQLVRTANFRPNGLVAHPRTYGVQDRLVDTTGQPKLAPQSWRDLTHLPSTRIPVNLENGASPNDGTIAIAGQWDQLLIGVRLDPVVHISRETTDGTDHAFSKYQFHFRIVARIDVQLARGAAFAVATGIND